MDAELEQWVTAYAAHALARRTAVQRLEATGYEPETLSDSGGEVERGTPEERYLRDMRAAAAALRVLSTPLDASAPRRRRADDPVRQAVSVLATVTPYVGSRFDEAGVPATPRKWLRAVEVHPAARMADEVARLLPEKVLATFVGHLRSDTTGVQLPTPVRPAPSSVRGRATGGWARRLVAGTRAGQPPAAVRDQR